MDNKKLIDKWKFDETRRIIIELGEHTLNTDYTEEIISSENLTNGMEERVNSYYKEITYNIIYLMAILSPLNKPDMDLSEEDLVSDILYNQLCLLMLGNHGDNLAGVGRIFSKLMKQTSITNSYKIDKDKILERFIADGIKTSVVLPETIDSIKKLNQELSNIDNNYGLHKYRTATVLSFVLYSMFDHLSEAYKDMDNEKHLDVNIQTIDRSLYELKKLYFRMLSHKDSDKLNGLILTKYLIEETNILKQRQEKTYTSIMKVLFMYAMMIGPSDPHNEAETHKYIDDMKKLFDVPELMED